jgi:hypothetical protein
VLLMPYLAGAETPAGTSLVLAESLGHSHELLGKLYQRRPGVEIEARGRELAAVACTLLEHLRVHGLDPTPYLKCRRRGDVPRKLSQFNMNGARFDAGRPLRDDAQGVLRESPSAARRRR